MKDTQPAHTITSGYRKSLSIKASLVSGWEQMRPMFKPPLLCRSLHVYLLQFLILLGYILPYRIHVIIILTIWNTTFRMSSIRLWLPQIFATISTENEGSYESVQPTDLCSILEYNTNHSNSNGTLSNCNMVNAYEIFAFEDYLYFFLRSSHYIFFFCRIGPLKVICSQVILL